MFCRRSLHSAVQGGSAFIQLQWDNKSIVVCLEERGRTLAVKLRAVGAAGCRLHYESNLLLLVPPRPTKPFILVGRLVGKMDIWEGWNTDFSIG